MDDLPVLRAYVDLPLHGERMAEDFRERYQNNRLKDFHAAVILGMAEEIPSIIDELVAMVPKPPRAVGVCGWSLGGLAAFLAAANEPRIESVAGYGVPGGKGHLRVKEMPTDADGLALLDQMDLHVRAKELYPTPILLMHGTRDERVSVESARSLHDGLRAHYAASPERLRYVEFRTAPHDPCLSAPEELQAIREEVRAWMETTLLD